MADAAKVPGKAASAAKESVKDAAQAVEETAEEVAPTVRGRFAAFRSDPDVKELEGKMKPALQSGIVWAAGMVLAPELTAGVAAASAVSRYRKHRKEQAQDQAKA